MSSPIEAELWKPGVCGICPAGCWVEVGMRDGRMVDIRPDTGHPLGMICRRGQHAPEIVYSDNRLRHPLRRRGPKGTHEFERIGWDEAYELIVERLQAIKAESGPEAVSRSTPGRGAFELLPLRDRVPAEGRRGVFRVERALPFGSPNTMGVGALCYVSFAMIAPHVTMGRMLVDMFVDIENAEVDRGLGANPATDSPAPGHAPAGGGAARVAPRSSSSIRVAPRRSCAPTPSGCRSVPAPTAHWRSA